MTPVKLGFNAGQYQQHGWGIIDTDNACIAIVVDAGEVHSETIYFIPNLFYTELSYI